MTGNSTINYSKKDELFVERARLIEVKFVYVYNANRSTILVEIFYANSPGKPKSMKRFTS